VCRETAPGGIDPVTDVDSTTYFGDLIGQILVFAFFVWLATRNFRSKKKKQNK
jgi:hypothetical protein